MVHFVLFFASPISTHEMEDYQTSDTLTSITHFLETMLLTDMSKSLQSQLGVPSTSPHLRRAYRVNSEVLEDTKKFTMGSSRNMAYRSNRGYRVAVSMTHTNVHNGAEGVYML